MAPVMRLGILWERTAFNVSEVRYVSILVEGICFDGVKASPPPPGPGVLTSPTNVIVLVDVAEPPPLNVNIPQGGDDCFPLVHSAPALHPCVPTVLVHTPSLPRRLPQMCGGLTALR